MTSRVAAPGAGTVLSDRYRLTGPLGAGGMGSVWEAEDLVLRRSVAVKVVHAAQQDDEVVLARFEREARTAARLSHPHLAMVFDYGESPEGLYLVMERLEGETLADRLREGPLDRAATAEIVAEAAEALAVAHAAGVVHRDVKPANLMLTDGGVKVMDFGIASGIGAPLTATGLVIGTAAYLAPERVQGQAAGPAADVYALGAVLYECLTGAQAFEGETPAEVAMGHLHRDPPDLSTVDPGTPPHLVAACHDALAKDPAARPTAAEMAGRLRREERPPDASATPGPASDPTATMAALPTTVPDGGGVDVPATAPSTRRRSPWPMLALALALLALVTAGAWALTRDDGDEGPIAGEVDPAATPTAPPTTAAAPPAPAPSPTTAAPATTEPPPTTTAPAAEPSADTLGDAAVAYLGLLDAGDFEAAWASTSPAFQAGQDRSSWETFWGSFDRIEVVGPPQVSEADRTVVVPLSFDGLREGYRVVLVAGPDGWLVDGPVGRR